jgi:hypothetical protein
MSPQSSDRETGKKEANKVVTISNWYIQRPRALERITGKRMYLKMSVVKEDLSEKRLGMFKELKGSSCGLSSGGERQP